MIVVGDIVRTPWGDQIYRVIALRHHYATTDYDASETAVIQYTKRQIRVRLNIDVKHLKGASANESDFATGA